MWVAIFVNCNPQFAKAADLDEVAILFNQGEYEKCMELSRAEVERGVWNDGWSKLLMRSLLATGKYEEAAEVYSLVKEKFSASIPLRMLAIEALRYSGKHADARALLTQIPSIVQAAPWRFSDRENMVAIGNFFLSVGEDPRQVLSAFYDQTLKSDPKFVEAHLATAELALGKNDYQEAVNSLRKAEKLSPDDPRVHYLLARAWQPSDNKRATAALETALKINPRHADSLLLQCDSLLDAEDLDSADEVIHQILSVNEKHPKAWALRAVINHLRGLYAKEGECRTKALSTWAQNPAVDYEIGRKLSRFYRFSDAIQYSRRAVSLDPSFMPARFQLAQDLLRIGAVDEGWTMVDQITQADKYNVVASNLQTLRERLSQFTTLETPGFVIRMDQREARIYGPRVIKLLGEAREVLCAKYEQKLSEPIAVEIFPKQSDFAIRTFGLPGGAGFLGVCFGKLITANSPASQGDSPSNWESVLWHEFCHVVTLQKTNNRMPRWLSEGISVYEELERDESWGQSMNPAYREMILGDDFVPLSKLSSAFLQPKTPMHLQFAYYEASLAVRYLIERHGMERLKKVLVDLGVGVPMHDALGRVYGESRTLDDDFKKYATEVANKLFSRSPIEDEQLPVRVTIDQLEKFVAEHPYHYKARRMLAQQLISAKKWSAALEVLKQLDSDWSEDAENGGTLESLALVYRQLNRIDDERKTLERIVKHSSDSLLALTRLIELARADREWDRVILFSNKLLAVQPLISLGHSALAEAASSMKDPRMAAEAFEAMLDLQPLDPGRLRYQLAESLFEMKDFDNARKHLLVALEETPRYRDALQLLVKVSLQRKALEEIDRSVSKTLALPDTSAGPPAPPRSK